MTTKTAKISIKSNGSGSMNIPPEALEQLGIEEPEHVALIIDEEGVAIVPLAAALRVEDPHSRE